MVSTLEPRKKYDQVIKAFNILWEKGLDVSLSIVGRKGWKIEKTVKLIENNSEYGKKLFWYNTGISDQELTAKYEESNAVIFASEAEGFGLAVSEAAYFKKPLILRNLSVFREIAGENAFYFEGYEAIDLAYAIEKWISLYKEGNNPDSSKIILRTWDDCAKDIFKLLTNASLVK